MEKQQNMKTFFIFKNKMRDLKHLKYVTVSGFSANNNRYLPEISMTKWLIKMGSQNKGQMHEKHFSFILECRTDFWHPTPCHHFYKFSDNCNNNNSSPTANINC